MNFLLSKNQISLALSSWAILSSGNSDTLLFCSLKIDLISYSKLRIDHEMRDFSDEIKQNLSIFGNCGFIQGLSSKMLKERPSYEKIRQNKIVIIRSYAQQ